VAILSPTGRTATAPPRRAHRDVGSSAPTTASYVTKETARSGSRLGRSGPGADPKHGPLRPMKDAEAVTAQGLLSDASADGVVWDSDAL